MAREILKNENLDNEFMKILEREAMEVQPGVVFNELRIKYLGEIGDMDLRWSVGRLLAGNKMIYTFDGGFKLLGDLKDDES